MAGEDKPFVAWVHTQPCRARDLHNCEGPIEAHHAGPRAYSKRAHDNTCIPLCCLAHRQWHDNSGPFKLWKRDQRRAWAQAAILATQADYEDSPRAHVEGGIPW